MLVAHGALLRVIVGEDDGNGGLGDARLPLFVNELLQVAGPHLAQVGDPQNEADGVQNVALAAVGARRRWDRGGSLTK